MDTQVQRVGEWREQKRRQGYRPLTVWLQADVKHLIEDLAAQYRQDPAQVVSAAIRAYAVQHSVRPTPEYVDVSTVRRLIQEHMSILAASEMPQEPGLAAPPSPRAADTLSPVLLPGEYGGTIQAVRRAAEHLGRFTCAQLARHISYKNSNVFAALRSLVKTGEVVKKGQVYFWTGIAPPPPKRGYRSGRPRTDATTG
jgi:hypothetical protein